MERQVTTEDIAAMVGTTANYVRNLGQKETDFPKPVRVIGRSKLFDAREVRSYFNARGLRPRRKPER